MIVLDDHIVHDNVLPVDSVHIAERWILLYSHSSLIYKYLKIVLVNLKKKKSIWKLTFKISFFLSFLHANTIPFCYFVPKNNIQRYLYANNLKAYYNSNTHNTNFKRYIYYWKISYLSKPKKKWYEKNLLYTQIYIKSNFANLMLKYTYNNNINLPA